MTENDVQTGDIVICYAWNAVAKAQAAAKSLNRLTLGAVKTTREIVTAMPKAGWHAAKGRTPRLPVVLELGDRVGIGAGSAKANHAMIVGPPVFLERPNVRDETDEEIEQALRELS